MNRSTFYRGLLALLLVVGFAFGAVAQQPAKLQGFATADAAATALTEAIRHDDDKAVSAMLGTGWRDFDTKPISIRNAIQLLARLETTQFHIGQHVSNSSVASHSRQKLLTMLLTSGKRCHRIASDRDG